jgi:hypothetical protein
MTRVKTKLASRHSLPHLCDVRSAPAVDDLVGTAQVAVIEQSIGANAQLVIAPSPAQRCDQA